MSDVQPSPTVPQAAQPQEAGFVERRRGPGRRRSDWRRAAEEGELNDEQFEFVMAIEEYKRLNNKPFPTWTEVLEVVRHLGYRKVAPMGSHINQVGNDTPQGSGSGPAARG